MSLPPIATRVHAVQQRIDAAARAAGRAPTRVTLIAVSKGHPPATICAAYDGGLRTFGESYVQELQRKAGDASLQQLSIAWHFLGHLQRNKVKLLLPHIAMLHSLDTLALAETIARHTAQPLACCIEVNIAQEASKSGVAPNAVRDLLITIAPLDNIIVRGLMCIPPPARDPHTNRRHFDALAALQDTLNRAACYPHALTELSMGMSDDFEIAIAAGATMVRIGTALFGERV